MIFIFFLFRRLSVTLCCSSFCAVLFDFASCCGVRLSLLKDSSQSITDSINDLDINIADPEVWVFW